jgi:hypothetical protein
MGDFAHEYIHQPNRVMYRLFEICFHFAGHSSSTQEFSAGSSEFLPTGD